MKIIIAVLAGLLLIGCIQTNPTQATTSSGQNASTATDSVFTPTATPNSSPTVWATATTASDSEASPTPALPKLDSNRFSRYLIQATDAPRPTRWCGQTCAQLKNAIRESACVQANAGQYQNPFFVVVNDSVNRANPEASEWDIQQACLALAPDVVFDCDAFANGTLSCGEGLTSCEGGGFHLRFDRTRFRNATGFETDTRIFVDSRAFKLLLDQDDCPKPS